MNKLDFSGRTAVVTGGAQGIGAAIVRRLQASGAEVIVWDLDGSPRVDVSDPASIQSAVKNLKKVDVLVNNAGIADGGIRAEELDPALFREVVAVNLTAASVLCRLVGSHMIAQGGGSIVNIGTMAAYSGGASINAYAASKGALLNLTKSMAQEWATWKVRVNILSPGPFMSEMMEGGERTAPGFHELVKRGTFMHRIADPTEIAGPVCYLVSDASSFVTGDDLSVSGGMFK